MIFFKRLCLLTLIFLSGCDEETVKKEETPVVIVDKQVKEVTQTPVYVPPIEPEIVIEMPAINEGLKEIEAKRLRGFREAKFKNAFKKKNSKKEKHLKLTDEDYRQWDSSFPEDKSTYPVDRSRILTEDTIINAILEREINSQVPGKTVAIIDRDILSPNGKNILLPAYTKIICHYEALSQTGDTRLPVNCTRAIRPDGVSIILSGAIAADQMGRVGLIGEVDNRTFERYGAAFIMSAISALAQSGVNPDKQSWVVNSSTILSNNLGQVTSEVIKQNIDLRPIISIKAGSKIMIVLQSDIVLRKPGEASE